MSILNTGASMTLLGVAGGLAAAFSGAAFAFLSLPWAVTTVALWPVLLAVSIFCGSYAIAYLSREMGGVEELAEMLSKADDPPGTPPE